MSIGTNRWRCDLIKDLTKFVQRVNVGKIIKVTFQNMAYINSHLLLQCFQYDLWRFHDTFRYKSWMNDIMNNAIRLKPWGVHQSEPEMHLPSKHLWLSLSLSDSFSIVPNNNLLSPFLVFQNDTRSLYFDTLSVFLHGEQCLTLSFVTKISLKKGLLIFVNTRMAAAVLTFSYPF